MADLPALLSFAATLQRMYPEMRKGQCAFYALTDLEPDCAKVVRGMHVDPFHDDAKLPEFWRFVGDWIGDDRA